MTITEAGSLREESRARLRPCRGVRKRFGFRDDLNK
jgi:hypothetical protein